MMTLKNTILGVAYVVLATGCSNAVNQNAIVQGRVIIDGELADQGTVAFHPKGEGPIAYGTIHKDGSFVMQIGQGRATDLDQSEIYPGEYLATVSINAPSTPDKEKGEGAPPIPGPRISSPKYSNKDTSGLSFTVKEGLNVIDISVDRVTPEELEALASSHEEATADSQDEEKNSSAMAPSDSEKPLVTDGLEKSEEQP